MHLFSFKEDREAVMIRLCSYLDSVVEVFSRPQETPEAISLFGCNCNN